MAKGLPMYVRMVFIFQSLHSLVARLHGTSYAIDFWNNNRPGPKRSSLSQSCRSLHKIECQIEALWPPYVINYRVILHFLEVSSQLNPERLRVRRQIGC